MTDTEIDLFEERDSLRRIRDYARQHMVGPGAVLGTVLLKACADTPPRVVIPGFVGTPKPLNLFVGFVGPSGFGKGASDDVGANYWPTTVPTFPVGTGEGIAQAFQPDDDGQPGIPQIIFSTSEVDNLKALGDRSGATLFPVLRQLATGDQLGQKNATKANSRVVNKMTYRACLSVGIQPERAGVLLGDASGGTPQRFLWPPVEDPDAPDDPPTGIEPLWPDHQSDFGSSGQRYEIPFPDTAKDEIRAHRLRVLRGDPTINPLDGHAYLTRCKVAAALMIIEGRNEVTEDDWRIAGRIMQVSDTTRDSIIRATQQAARNANTARALAAAERDEIVSDRKLQRAREAVLRRLDRYRQQTKNQLRMGLKVDVRDYLDAAISDLLDRGEIAVSAAKFSLWEGHMSPRDMPQKPASTSEDEVCPKRTYVPPVVELVHSDQPRRRRRTRGKNRNPQQTGEQTA